MSKQKKEKKIFVLDTSVIIYEHNSILNFDEHDIGIPITVLEELDNFKKGNDTKNFEAREFIRLIDKLAKDQMLHHWNPINGKGKENSAHNCYGLFSLYGCKLFLSLCYCLLCLTSLSFTLVSDLLLVYNGLWQEIEFR